MKKYIAVLAAALLVAAAALFSAGCAGDDKSEDKTIKFGVLPIMDNLPFWVAAREGYFEDEGVDVELVPFDSAMVRDSAISSGEVDGALGDILALVALNNGGTPVKAVAVGQGVTAEEGRFALLTAPDSGLTDPGQLKNVEIAVSLNTIIEYVTDRMLQDAGLQPGEIKKTSMAKIPARLEALLNGEIKAAVLPDPPAAIAELRGANLVLDDTYDNITQTIIYFRAKTLENKPEAVKALMRAYTRAVRDIQNQPEEYHNLLVEKARVPRELLEQPGKTGLKVVFSEPVLPAEEDLREVMAWMKEHDLLDRDYSYQELVAKEVLQ